MTAQSNYKIYKYGIKEGLSSENIYKTIIVPSGEIYLATQRGLILYDGHRFINHKTIKNNVLSLVNHQNQLYLCDEKGLNVLSNIHQKTNLLIPHKHTDNNPNNDHYENIFVDRKNRIWTTDFENIKYYDPQTNKIHTFKYNPLNKYLDLNIPIIELNDGQIWSPNAKGLWFYDESQNKLQQHFNPIINQLKYTAATKKDENTLILATENGDFFEFHIQNNTIKYLPNLPKNEIIKGIITKQNDLIIYNSKGIYELKNEQINLIYETENAIIQHVNYDSSSNIIWISTNQGLIKLSPINPAIELIKIPNNNAQIISITEDNSHKIWAIDNQNNVWLIDQNTIQKVFHTSENLSSINYSNQEILLTSTQHIYRWNSHHFEQLNLTNLQTQNLNQSIITPQNELWILASQSIQRFSWPELNPIQIPFNNPTEFWTDNKWQDLITDQKGRIWLAGWMPKSFGICYYNPILNQFIDVSDKKINPDRGLFVGDYFTKIGLGKDESILFTAYGGWNRTNSEGKLMQKVDVLSHEIADTYLKGISEDKNGNVFFATSEGLHIYRKNLDQVFRISQIDGLPKNNVTHSFYALNQYKIAVGFEGEIALINLEEILDSELKNRLKLTQIKVNGNPIEMNSNFIELQKNERDLILSFSDLAYLDHEKVNFKYKFSDEEIWNDLNLNPEIYLNHIQPGKYDLIIEASDNLGNSQEQNLEINILAHPPFTKSNIFYGLLILLFLGIVFGLNRYLWLKQKEKQTYLRQIKGAEMQTLRSQMNPHFLFNTLNSINSFIIQNQSDDASSYLTKFSKLMRSILENSKLESISLKNELKTLKLYIELESVRLEHSFDYEIIVDEDLDEETTMVPPLIIQPFVENAIWHGLRNKQNGFLEIYIRPANENTIKIHIADNGIGRKASQKLKTNQTQHKSYGIDITINRLQILNQDNKIEIVDLYNKENQPTGTEIIITLNR